MGTPLTVRDQASLFALMVVARPVTNRELRLLAGAEITADVRRRANEETELIDTKKMGVVHTHGLTPAGKTWCESMLAAGRPDGTKFPTGVLYALLESVSQHLARSGTKLDDFFTPDIDSWIRSVYSELTRRRGPGNWVRLSALRAWLGGVPRDVVDAELDRMIELPEVELMAELNQQSLTDEDRKAAVNIGGEDRHLLKIGAL